MTCKLDDCCVWTLTNPINSKPKHNSGGGVGIQTDSYSDTANVDARTAGPFQFHQPSSPSSFPCLTLNFPQPTWWPQPEPKPCFLLPHCQSHHYSHQPTQSFSRCPNPWHAIQAPILVNPKVPRNNISTNEFNSVGRLLRVFWDSKDQETSSTVAPCWAPCGWHRAHFFHCSLQTLWLLYYAVQKMRVCNGFCAHKHISKLLKLLRCVMLWLDGWFCLPNAPDVMVVFLQCVFTLRCRKNPWGLVT